MTIKQLQKLCHKSAVKLGFWGYVCLCKNATFGYGYNKKQIPICVKCHKSLVGIRNDGEMIALMHSELSEALEELRKEKINWDNVGEELADCLIRIMDFCEARGIDLEKETKKKIKKNKKRKYKHGKRF